jgi:hypothetical protein
MTASAPVRVAAALRRGVAALLLASLLPLGTTGCFGTFQLTRKVYDFNRTVSPDRWIRWLFFLGMNVVPVYAFSMAVDVFFANPVEFWGGRNPIRAGLGAGDTRVVRGEDGAELRLTWLGAERLRMESRGPDGSRHVAILSRTAEGAEARDASGRLLGRLVAEGGEPRLVGLR